MAPNFQAIFCRFFCVEVYHLNMSVFHEVVVAGQNGVKVDAQRRLTNARLLIHYKLPIPAVAGKEEERPASTGPGPYRHPLL